MEIELEGDKISKLKFESQKLSDCVLVLELLDKSIERYICSPINTGKFALIWSLNNQIQVIHSLHAKYRGEW